MEMVQPREDDIGHISDEPTIFGNEGLEDDDSEEPSEEDFPSAPDSTGQTTARNAVDGESPIAYHYLTFDTTLPSPSTSLATDALGVLAPPPPDLARYTSPFDWPESRKNFTMSLSCIATAITAYTAGSYAPASSYMAAEWNVSRVAVTVGITTFCAGFAMAPMALAPFSEINGRYPVFVGAGILYLICQVCCAVTRSYPGMLVARFWVGAGSSVFSTMVGGVVSDMYHAEQRNTPMALFSGAALFGTGLGPLVSGFVAQNTSWRWVFWVQVITCGCLITAVTLFFRETRGSIILSRKAQCLNRWYEEREAAGYVGFSMSIASETVESQRIRWKVKSDDERESITKMIGISVYRPFHLLVTEPVVFFFSLW
ncbi:MFS multidrug transporter [Marssonina coronariae]|uniref:MFS multidrug transporter n=1 Tax=Diplocarpon coronariae TaxID=2795749 RepID=A0A218Z9W7_9HELO|nr:MFS multidrug transporter [Marssonina coronariae]